MSDGTKIEWADATWNPIVGCTKVSAGCANCYIDRTPPFRIEGRHFTESCPECSGLGGFAAVACAGRVEVAPPCLTCQGTGRVRSHAIGSTTGVRLHPERLDQPLRWRRPRRIFVNSLSDLFHEAVPDDFIAHVWAVMTLAPQHVFQVLTKRHARMRSLLSAPRFQDDVWRAATVLMGERGIDKGRHFAWPLPNVWLGVSVEDQATADLRIPALLDTPAAVRLLSCEPLLGPMDLQMAVPRPCTCGPGQTFLIGETRAHKTGCPALRWPFPDWVIVGGESGPGARPMHPDWARSLRDQCAPVGVPYFFKQWGEHGPDGRRVGRRAAGDLLDGRQHHEWPVSQ